MPRRKQLKISAAELKIHDLLIEWEKQAIK